MCASKGRLGSIQGDITMGVCDGKEGKWDGEKEERQGSVHIDTGECIRAFFHEASSRHQVGGGGGAWGNRISQVFH